MVILTLSSTATCLLLILTAIIRKVLSDTMDGEAGTAWSNTALPGISQNNSQIHNTNINLNIFLIPISIIFLLVDLKIYIFGCEKLGCKEYKAAITTVKNERSCLDDRTIGEEMLIAHTEPHSVIFGTFDENDSINNGDSENNFHLDNHKSDCGEIASTICDEINDVITCDYDE